MLGVTWKLPFFLSLRKRKIDKNPKYYVKYYYNTGTNLVHPEESSGATEWNIDTPEGVVAHLRVAGDFSHQIREWSFPASEFDLEEVDLPEVFWLTDGWTDPSSSDTEYPHITLGFLIESNVCDYIVVEGEPASETGSSLIIPPSLIEEGRVVRFEFLDREVAERFMVVNNLIGSKGWFSEDEGMPGIVVYHNPPENYSHLETLYDGDRGKRKKRG